MGHGASGNDDDDHDDDDGGDDDDDDDDDDDVVIRSGSTRSPVRWRWGPRIRSIGTSGYGPWRKWP
jgi:hypothetical protein